MYSPLDHVGGIKAPVMFISAAQDALCPHEVCTKQRKQALAIELLCVMGVPLPVVFISAAQDALCPHEVYTD